MKDEHLKVHVVETEANGRWFVWRADEYRDNAWEMMRRARAEYPRTKFRTRTYRPTDMKDERRT